MHFVTFVKLAGLGSISNPLEICTDTGFTKLCNAIGFLKLTSWKRHPTEKTAH